jgi:orotate phosphoribosyltransferase
VLKFGSFKTKSGRDSPYFFNFGAIDDGLVLSQLATCYADLILQKCQTEKLHLFGPAYKGIPLAASIAQDLSHRLGRGIPFSFNRKEIKSHGEGGRIVGRAINETSEITIVEDVMTGGTSVRDTMEFLLPLGAKVKAVIIGVDREERGVTNTQASAEIASTYGIPVIPILKLSEVIELLYETPRLGKVWIDAPMREQIDRYRGCF